MFKKNLLGGSAAVALAIVPAQHVAADTGDFLGGVVTGVIGTIIVNEATKNKPPRTTTTVVNPTRTVVVTPDSPQRAANRVTQTALNYFGFNAGGADGIFGPRTASAVQAYQSFMQFPVVGKLTNFERDVLVAAYNRGQAGDFETLQLINTNPLGVRALLLDTRDRLMGINTNTVTVNNGTSTGVPVTPNNTGGGANVVNVSDIPDTVITPAPGIAPEPETVLAPTPEPETPPAGGGIPLIPIPVSTADVAGYCAGAEGGLAVITPASMTDPDAAMVQLFCQARGEAMDNSTALIAGVPGVTVEQIEAQCTQLGPVMQPYVASVASKSRTEVIADVNGFIAGSGADPAQLASTAEICLGTGYDLANMDVALGSALLLAAMGQSGYGELAGHHLRNGFGVGTNEDRAMDWLVWTTDELATGATAVFGDAGRTQLFDEAVFQLNGGAPSSAAKSGASKGKN